jgi:hypothetical protein
MPSAEQRVPIVVDGANVAYEDKTRDGRPKLENILAVRQQLVQLGYRPIVIVDAALWHTIDQSKRLDQLIQEGEILQAPADTDADYFVLKTAELENAKIVTNDLYADHRAEFPDVQERRVPLMIVDGMVELYQLEPAESG